MKSWKKVRRFIVPLLFVSILVLLSGCSESIRVLDPKGPIGESQKDLILISSLLCAIILVPVLALTAFIVYRYRDKPGNKAAYKPNWSHSTLMETIWWGIPVVIITILAIVTVKGTYDLEPSKPLDSEKKPLVIQATSLDWKWLFKYPEQGIATVNYIEIPEDVPIRFELTSDAPMNSFWIPELGGQMYTMSGMAMKLHLQADEPGEYYGSGANFSGEHFADMKFTVRATSEAEFNKWVESVKQTSPALTEEGYQQLAKPGKADVQYFSSFPEGLFERIVTKYVVEGDEGHAGHRQMTTEESPSSEPEQPKSDMSHEHAGH